MCLCSRVVQNYSTSNHCSKYRYCHVQRECSEGFNYNTGLNNSCLSVFHFEAFCAIKFNTAHSVLHTNVSIVPHNLHTHTHTHTHKHTHTTWLQVQLHTCHQIGRICIQEIWNAVRILLKIDGVSGGYTSEKVN